MADNEKKTNQELADEALDAVSGGVYARDTEYVRCAGCNNQIRRSEAAAFGNNIYFCSTCVNDPTGAKIDVIPK